jgi:hypothetical protein
MFLMPVRLGLIGKDANATRSRRSLSGCAARKWGKFPTCPLLESQVENSRYYADASA